MHTNTTGIAIAIAIELCKKTKVATIKWLLNPDVTNSDHACIKIVL